MFGQTAPVVANPVLNDLHEGRAILSDDTELDFPGANWVTDDKQVSTGELPNGEFLEFKPENDITGMGMRVTRRVGKNKLDKNYKVITTFVLAQFCSKSTVQNAIRRVELGV